MTYTVYRHISESHLGKGVAMAAMGQKAGACPEAATTITVYDRWWWVVAPMLLLVLATPEIIDLLFHYVSLASPFRPVQGLFLPVLLIDSANLHETH